MDTIGPTSEPTREQANPSLTPSSTPFPLVGIGASAGGIPALQLFFTHMPADSGMAFVVILHLSPTHESLAASLLQHTTTMPVVQVVEAVAVVPNHVYVIPPTQDLSMVDGTIQLQERAEARAACADRSVLPHAGRDAWPPGRRRGAFGQRR